VPDADGANVSNKFGCPRRLECPRCTTCLVSHDPGLGNGGLGNWIQFCRSCSLYQRIIVADLISQFSQRMMMSTRMVAALAHCHIALCSPQPCGASGEPCYQAPNRGLSKAAARQGTSKLKESHLHMRVTRHSSAFFWGSPQKCRPAMRCYFAAPSADRSTNGGAECAGK
jgi:hypothetical protein